MTNLEQALEVLRQFADGAKRQSMPLDECFDIIDREIALLRDGLTHAEIRVACRNVGIDLDCDACAATFYTGGVFVEKHSCGKRLCEKPLCEKHE